MNKRTDLSGGGDVEGEVGEGGGDPRNKMTEYRVGVFAETR